MSNAVRYPDHQRAFIGERIAQSLVHLFPRSRKKISSATIICALSRSRFFCQWTRTGGAIARKNKTRRGKKLHDVLSGHILFLRNCTYSGVEAAFRQRAPALGQDRTCCDRLVPSYRRDESQVGAKLKWLRWIAARRSAKVHGASVSTAKSVSGSRVERGGDAGTRRKPTRRAGGHLRPCASFAVAQDL
jgi:hypothetical protein